MTEKLTKEAIVEGVLNLTVLELAELVKTLEEKTGIKAQAAVAMPVAGASAPAAGASTEAKTDFSVILANPGSNKIQVIKVVREITGLGLKEAKDFVDGAPKAVKEGVPKDQAEELKKKLEAAGATVELK